MAIVVNAKTHRWRLLAAHSFLIGFIALMLFPLVMIVLISLRPGNTPGGSILPETISLEHWSLALGIPYVDADGTVTQPPFPVLRWLLNSIIVASTSALLILALATTSAYAFARLRFKFKNSILTSILLLQMFPAVLALIAIRTIFEFLGEQVPWLGIDTLGAVILAYVGGISLHIWTIKGYFETIPAEIEEAAHVDGASAFQAFRLVLLPMAVPILAVVFILAFINGIIEYPVASVLLSSQETYTLAVGANQYLYPQHYRWGDFAAAAILSGLPITVVFLLAQKWMVAGLTAGGVKT
ncbi:maltose ABC transporter permease MalG [Haliangium ochraceum]|uniref:Maltose/maltodextrin transport system permease protein MalG n=1 Tax=Haliangium ochraceum (strain DSM 14365 / JCM 11303 / SMP-2) TaxID=502025 RepID=D0LWJ1_HALO1|nr:maltose ABC transporter permease MalG [Haliangium ochraceum]ACY17641.1 binding-protein-dependent transport systems inner membrane component [Haliangium ochraceum DSM 14365]